jgi:GT2 family glycosyltransferase
MNRKTTTAVVILNFNSAAHTLDCVKSLKTHSASLAGTAIVVVDNASAPEDRERLAPLTAEDVELVLSGKNLGFSGGMMLGAVQAQADYYLLLNNDCSFESDVLATLSSFMDAHPEAALCTGAMFDEDGKPRSSFNYFPSLFHALFGYGLSRLLSPTRYPDRRVQYREPVAVEVVSGAAMFIRGSVLRDLGGLDTGYFLYCEEEDFALRVHRAGWKTYLVPQARIMHIGGASSGGEVRRPALQREFYISFFRYLRRHHGRFYTFCFRMVTVLKLWRRALRGRADFELVKFVWRGAPEKDSLRYQA